MYIEEEKRPWHCNQIIIIINLIAESVGLNRWIVIDRNGLNILGRMVLSDVFLHSFGNCWRFSVANKFRRLVSFDMWLIRLSRSGKRKWEEQTNKKEQSGDFKFVCVNSLTKILLSIVAGSFVFVWRIHWICGRTIIIADPITWRIEYVFYCHWMNE